METIGRPITNIIGKRYGKLTVVKQAAERTPDGSVQWECQCDCGNIRTHSGSRLRQYKVQSCGCFTGESLQRRMTGKTKNKHHSWKGYGEISGKMFGMIKDGATKRNHVFNISINQIWDLFLKQNRRCAYSGVILTFNTKQGVYDGSASLDRIDSSKGYVEGNIQWVHKDLQHAKMSLSDEIFMKWVKTIYEYKRLDLNH